MQGASKTRRFISSSIFTGFLISGLTAALAAGTSPEARAAGTATVSGKVSFSGAPPSREKIKMAADPVCLQQHKDAVLVEDVVVTNGGLQNVFVYVKDGLKPGNYPASTAPVVLTQQGCMYNPHIFGIQVGQPLEIRNEDPTLHNINAQPKDNKRFNIAQPTKGMKTVKTFDKKEVMVPFKCNVHPWMAGYGGVLDHPFFAVSSPDGSFTIAGLPAGTYTLEAWHEKLGTETQTVTMADGETKQVTFSFKAK